MQAFEEYRNKDASFWALIKFVSEGLGYTHRGRGMVKSFSSSEIMLFCSGHGISINEQTACLASQYSIKRASLLNDIAQHMLMDAETAEAEFQKLLPYHKKYGYTCKLPLNKQKGDMKKIAFYTAIINIMVIPLSQPEESPEYGTQKEVNWCHETGKRGKGSWRRKSGIPWGRL